MSAEFEDAFRRHNADVLRYALVLCRDYDEAEDIAAETFARGWAAWRRGHEPTGDSLPWLLAIARNISLDRWRRIARRARSPKRHVPTADHLAEAESLVWLEMLARVLPPRQREVIALRYHRDLSDKEIGKIMQLSESGVRSLISRAITGLREHPEVWR